MPLLDRGFKSSDFSTSTWTGNIWVRGGSISGFNATQSLPSTSPRVNPNFWRLVLSQQSSPDEPAPPSPPDTSAHPGVNLYDTLWTQTSGGNPLYAGEGTTVAYGASIRVPTGWGGPTNGWGFWKQFHCSNFQWFAGPMFSLNLGGTNSSPSMGLSMTTGQGQIITVNGHPCVNRPAPTNNNATLVSSMLLDTWYDFITVVTWGRGGTRSGFTGKPGAPVGALSIYYRKAGDSNFTLVFQDLSVPTLSWGSSTVTDNIGLTIPNIQFVPGLYGSYTGTTSTMATVTIDIDPIGRSSVGDTNGGLNTLLNAYSSSVGGGTPSVPTNTALPVISGTAADNQGLGTDNGGWTNSPTSFRYQWYRANAQGLSPVAITGATSNTYNVNGADVGSTLIVGVVATNSGGDSTEARSVATAVVAPTALTFGRATIGSHASSPVPTSIDCCRLTLPANIGTVSKFSAYLDATNGAFTGRIVVYSDNGSQTSPNLFIAATQEVVLTSGIGPGWVDFNFPSPIDVSSYQNQTVWYGFWYGGTTGHMYDDAPNNVIDQAVTVASYSSSGNPSAGAWTLHAASGPRYSLYGTYATPVIVSGAGRTIGAPRVAGTRSVGVTRAVGGLGGFM